MTKKQREEINIKIAKLLGFTEYHDGQWGYPEKYAHLRPCVPCTSIPDFVSCIDMLIDISGNLRYGIPTEHFI